MGLKAGALLGVWLTALVVGMPDETQRGKDPGARPSLRRGGCGGLVVGGCNVSGLSFSF